MYDGVLEPPLVGRLLDAGLLLLLRFALDDTAEPVLTAALAAMEALLTSRPDEVSSGRGQTVWEPLTGPSNLDRSYRSD